MSNIQPIYNLTNVHDINIPPLASNKNLIPVKFNLNLNLSTINEFQMISLNENNTLTTNNDSCLVITRPIIKTIPVNNCSKPRYVLCKTTTILTLDSEPICFIKPLTLGLPTIISSHLTYELCLSVCKGLGTKLAVIHINRCYCFNPILSATFDLVPGPSIYKKPNCGSPCPGNKHEHCGNLDTIVAFKFPADRFTSGYDISYRDTVRYPDFVYDSCVHLNSFDRSAMYLFDFQQKSDIYPRYCLLLCRNYQQKYALINSNKCLCTNYRLNNEKYDNCTLQCSANYFYTCGNASNSSLYSMYVMTPRCPIGKKRKLKSYYKKEFILGFEVAQDERRCIRVDVSTKKGSFKSAQSYCKSIGGMLAKINDTLEIQDVIPMSMLTNSLSKGMSYFYLEEKFNDTLYFWIDRTSIISNRSSNMLNRMIERCSEISKTTDRHCIVLRHEKLLFENKFIYQRCFTESNECSSMSAIPICVDKHLDSNSNIISSTKDDHISIISVNTSIDYSCDNDEQYHLIGDYCYKIDYHETTWHEAKLQCERDKAMLFIPEKISNLNLIKEFFLRQYSFTKSGVAHIGVFYDNQNRTVMQMNTTHQNDLRIVPSSEAIHTLCEKTFHQRYEQLISSSFLSNEVKQRIKTQQSGCAYVNFRSNSAPSISCDEIPCNQLATVICQKLPIRQTRLIIVKRLPFNGKSV